MGHRAPRRAAALAAAVSLVASLAACGGSGSSGTTAPAAASAGTTAAGTTTATTTAPSRATRTTTTTGTSTAEAVPSTAGSPATAPAVRRARADLLAGCRHLEAPAPPEPHDGTALHDYADRALPSAQRHMRLLNALARRPGIRGRFAPLAEGYASLIALYRALGQVPAGTSPDQIAGVFRTVVTAEKRLADASRAARAAACGPYTDR